MKTHYRRWFERLASRRPKSGRMELLGATGPELEALAGAIRLAGYDVTLSRMDAYDVITYTRKEDLSLK